ncbi:MAG TPA: LytTR family DNA-binding domain-containing protein [Chitinophagaceae bacterium]|jgi:DNA-binding LytR/AlgR family response regulator|nr:LytTR family DNA-binding domain-containing protein [Chitinophagaceae bacterium]
MTNAEKNITCCLVVDDEPMARDVLRRYIEKIPTLQLIGECSNAIDALLFLQNNKVDLIFLDIRMPELLGTEFVESLQNPPKIIFTTAFKEYALDGFELEAVDYLLKPVRFERFLRAVNKAFPKKDIEHENSSGNSPKKTGTDFIYLRVDRKLVKILLADMLYIESARDYVKVFTKDKSYITRQTISSIEAMLSGNEFIRIHKSYIISISKIKSFTNELVEIANKELPIGKFYRNSFVKMIG